MNRLPESAASALTPVEVCRAVDAAFRLLADGRLLNPPRAEQVGRDDDPDFFRLELPSTLTNQAGQPLLRGCKVIEEHGARDATGQRRLGQRLATLQIDDLVSGQSVTMPADAITDLRTGAAAACAASYLAPPVRRVGLIGTGRVALATARMVDCLLRPEQLVATSRTATRRQAFAAELAGSCQAAVTLVETAAEACRGADLVVAAVPAAEPVLTLANAGDVPCLVLVEGDPRAVMAEPALLLSRPVTPDCQAQAERTGSVMAVTSSGGTVPWATTADQTPATLADAAVGRLAALRGQPVAVLLTGLGALDLAVGVAVWSAAGGPLTPLAE